MFPMKTFALVRVEKCVSDSIPQHGEESDERRTQGAVLGEQVSPERSTVFLPLSEVFAENRRKGSAKGADGLPRKESNKKDGSFPRPERAVSPAAIGAAVGLGASRTNDLLRELRSEGVVMAEGNTRSRIYSLMD